MYKPCLKSEVFENPKTLMWCSNQTNGAKIGATNSIADEAISNRKQADNGEQAQSTAIAIVQPRQTRYTRCRGTTSRQSREWSVVPQDVYVNNDVVRLVSSLSTVIQILVRMSNTAAHELLRHPERGEEYEGLRLLLNYADLMYTTLLQPQPHSEQRSSERTSSGGNDSIPSGTLFHNLFRPMLVPSERREQAFDRSLTPTFPYRVITGIASVAEPPVAESADPAVESTNIDANVN